MKERRVSRELALEVLYRVEIGVQKKEEILADSLSRRNYSKEIKVFAVDLISKALANIQGIDKLISQTAKNWSLKRIAILDKNILRLAITELLYFPEIPPKVSIDEAIEIAKKYSTEKSGMFINGILDKIMKSQIPNPPKTDTRN